MLESTMNTRRINLFCNNVSDKIIRSDKIDCISEKDIDFLLKEKINIIIDLRTSKKRNSVLQDDKRFTYFCCPFDTSNWDDDIFLCDESLINQKLVAEYMAYIDQKQVINTIADIILKSDDCRILIMCHNGKDRTGVVIAPFLMLVSCSENSIVKDYAISSELLNQKCSNNKFINLKSNPMIMKNFISQFKLKYNSAEQYFGELGWSKETIDELELQLII